MPKREFFPLEDPGKDRKNIPIISPMTQIIVETEGDRQQIFDTDASRSLDPSQTGVKESSSRPVALNFRFLVVVCLIVVSISTGSHFLHRFQVRSMAEIYLELAENAEQEGQDDLAKSHYRNYLRLNPDNRAAKVNYSLLYHRTAKSIKERRHSISILEDLLRKNEHRDDIRRILIDAYMEIGRQYAPQYRNALRHIEYFLTENTDDFELVEFRAECFWKLGNIDGAITDYRALLKTSPLRFDLFERLAHLYRFELDNIEKADRIMDSLVATNPQAWEVYYLRAKYHRRHMKLRKAALDIRRAWQFNKTEPSVLLLAVEMSISTRGLADFSNVVEFSALRQSLSQIVPNRDNEVEIALAIANLDLIDERPVEAMNRMTQIVDKYPQNMPLKRLLCELKIRFGELDEAEILISEMNTGTSNSSNTSIQGYFEARLLFERKRYLESIRLLKKLSTEVPQSSTLASKVTILLAESYGRIGWTLHQYNTLNIALQAGDLGHFDLFRIAQGFDSLGKYDRSLALYRKFHPNASIVERMAQAEISKNLVQPSAQQDWNRADSLVSILSQFPEKKEIAVRLRADIHVARKKIADGISYVENELKKQPDNTNLKLTLVGLLIREKRFSEARSHLDRFEKPKKRTPELLASEIFYWTEITSEDSAQYLHSLLAEIGKLRTENRLSEGETYGLQVSLAHAFDRINNLQASLEVWKLLATQNRQDVSVTLSWLDAARRLEDLSTVKSIVERLEKTNEAANPYLCLAKAAEAILEANQGGNKQVLDDAISMLSSPNVKSYRNSRQFMLAFAQLYEAQNRWNEAIRFYEMTIELDENRPDVFRRLIQLLYRMRNYRLAEIYLDKLGKKSPEEISGSFGQLAADISLRLRDNDRALEIAKNIVSQSPDDFRRRLWFAQLLAIVGKSQEAEKAFQETIAMDPSHPEPRVAYIFYLIRKSRKKEAESAIAEAISKIDSSFKDLSMAQCYDQLENYEQAEDHYNKSLENHPQDPHVKIAVADFHFRRGSFSKAENLYNSIIENDSKVSIFARRQKSLVLMARDGFREFEHSLELVEENLKDNPESVTDELLKANILSSHPALTRRNEAIRIFESVERRLTLNAENRYLLARLYLSVGDWVKSRDLMNILLTTDRQNPTYLATYIEQKILHRELTGLFNIAMKHLKSVAPESPNTVYLEMLSLASEDRLEEAKKILKDRIPNRKENPQAVARSLLLKARICSDLTQSLNAIGYAVQARHFAVLADGLFKELLEKDRSKTLDYARYLKSQFDVTAALQLTEANFDFCAPEELAAVVIELLRTNPNDRQNLRLARNLLDRIEKRNPDSGVVIFQLANLNHIEGNYNEAIKLYRKTLQKIPNSVVALNELAMLLAFEGKHLEKARLHIDLAIRLAGPRANLLDTRAMIFYALGDFNTAEKDLVQATDQSPSAVKYYHLAQVKEALDRRADAKIALRRGQSLGLQATRLHPLERAKFAENVQTINN